VAASAPGDPGGDPGYRAGVELTKRRCRQPAAGVPPKLPQSSPNPARKPQSLTLLRSCFCALVAR
jgi:hypothetical protein